MGDGGWARVERGGEGWRRRCCVVMVVVMLLLSPLSVLAAPWAAWTVAALFVAAVPPLSEQWWRRGFVL